MYTTVADFLARHNRADNPELTQLCPDPDDATEPDAVRLAQALTEASGQMDLYLGTHHDLPLTGLSDAQAADLARICCDIARYRLWADQASKEVRQRYDDATAFLEQAASGRIRLGASPTSARPPALAAGTRALVYGADFVTAYTL
jgi:phage gp36-like protein